MTAVCRIRPSARHAILFTAAAALLTGCARRPGADVPTGPTPDAVYVLEPVLTNASTAFASLLLDQLFPGAVHFTAPQAEQALNRCLTERRVLILPSASDIPLNLWKPLRDFLDRGGPAIFWGRNPLASRIGLGVDGYERASALQSSLAGRARPVEALRPAATVAATIVEAAGAPWPAVEIIGSNVSGRVGVSLDGLPAGSIDPTENMLVFHLRGGAGATRIVAEVVEADGSVWIAVFPLTPAWSPVFAHEASFSWAGGGENRGDPDDHLDLSRATSLFIGVDADLTPRLPGDLSFGLSEIRPISDPRSLEESVLWPDLPLFAPPTRRYDVKAATIDFIGTGQDFPARGLALQSPLPLPTGTGGEEADEGRWIPLARALDENGSAVGWPASLYVRGGDASTISHFGWIAADPLPEHRALLEQMLRTCVRRLLAGHFLHHVGAARCGFDAGRTFDVSARWSHGLGTAQPMRIAAELIDHEGRTVRRVLSPAPPEGGTNQRQPVTLGLGTSRRMGATGRDVIVRISLVDREDRTTFDSAEQRIKILPEKPPFDDRPAVEGSLFTIGRRPLFLLGVEYAPLMAADLAGDDDRTWLRASHFDLRLIQRDLDQIQQAGMTMISVPYKSAAEAFQLRALIEEARVRNMWVMVYVNGLDPLEPDLETARELIAAAQLAENPRVFAISISRSFIAGSEPRRRRLDPLWKSWIEEQYGSVERAEELHGVPVWRLEGKVTGPPDAALVQGAHPFVQVYRRFMQDHASRWTGRVRRFLVSQNCRQLLTARFGVNGFGSAASEPLLPIDPFEVGIHMDFVMLDGAGLSGSLEEIQGAGFLTAYARGATGGKPAVWTRIGACVGEQPGKADLDNAGRIAEQAIDMALRSRAAGAFARAFPGVGLRDAGIVGPHGQWRPAGLSFQKAAVGLRQATPAPQPWRGRELPILPAPQGLSALWGTWRETYRMEVAGGKMEEVRPGGFGAETRNATFMSLADARFSDPSPYALLNAEWGAVRVGGEDAPREPGSTLKVRARQEVKLEIVNSGPATWSASQERQSRTVWIRATQADKPEQKLRIPGLAYGERTTVAWPAADPGLWQLRPWVSEGGAFGEPLRIDVSAPAQGRQQPAERSP